MKKKIVNVVLFLAVLAAALGMTFYVGNNAMSVLLYNFVFLGIIAVVYVVGLFGGMFRMNRLAQSLGDAAQELEDMYPDKTPKERENLITKEHGCVFLMKIGDKLASGEPHDGRAPDYDDWQLNGDILFWFETLNCALEISSMGIRVDEKALEEQLVKAGCEERKNLPYHKMLLNGELPYTIGGGIGQSRLCMLLLDRAHVGEVQASLWPEQMRKTCKEHNMILL